MRFRLWPFGRKEELDCPEVRELSSYLVDEDRGAPEGLIERLQRHLEGCQPCSAFVRTLQATIDLVRSLPQQQASDGLKERIRYPTGSDGE